MAGGRGIPAMVSFLCLDEEVYRDDGVVREGMEEDVGVVVAVWVVSRRLPCREGSGSSVSIHSSRLGCSCTRPGWMMSALPSWAVHGRHQGRQQQSGTSK